ncbi:hypothetical protein A2Z22_05410 [Candidatus Woesebacteria bacterium RBG_16_34_12]|uniref:Peptidase C39-like domain-containing protein n=1 Tax=Candidatus Woesebacteria bacterium RBG_16_34_12 TaxID=1802480 RepID=A0A1F7X6K6_9BACT|nr:MAG: hypothetical protein A2Z22_05410 [Candidatus Woesebacteria bacterium RBG_16_34_12]
MKKSINWKKYHKFREKKEWCGPAVIQMVLKASGIRRTQKEIAKDVYKPWWGTNQQTMLAYLSRFFKLVNFKQNATISDITFHLKKGHIVVVNWWDNFPPGEPEGHYTIVSSYDNRKKEITMVDPAILGPLLEKKGIYAMKVKEFNKRWYDYLDIHGSTWIEGWMLWVNPQSKLKKAK